MWKGLLPPSKNNDSYTVLWLVMQCHVDLRVGSLYTVQHSNTNGAFYLVNYTTGFFLLGSSGWLETKCRLSIREVTLLGLAAS